MDLDRCAADCGNNVWQKVSEMSFCNRSNLNGNMLTEGGKVYAYNSLNQLISLTENGQTTTYDYWIDGLRRSKTLANGDEEEYLWDGNNLVYVNPSLSEYLLTGFTAYYGLGIFESNQNGTKYRYQRNAHGDTTALIDQSGDIVRCYTYEDAFGTSTYSTDDTNPFRYAGQYYDRESQSYYLRARYYLPRYGRFTAEDPARDGLNWYTYCANNPIRYSDPSGLDAIVANQTWNVLRFGHMSSFVQDSDGTWYFFYWGNDSVLLESIDDPSILNDADTLNEWLTENDFNKSKYEYDAFCYIAGDFSESVEYYKSLLDQYSDGSGNGSRNGNYDLLFDNCTHETMRGIFKGTIGLEEKQTVKSIYNGLLYSVRAAPNANLSNLQQIFENKSLTYRSNPYETRKVFPENIRDCINFGYHWNLPIIIL